MFTKSEQESNLKTDSNHLQGINKLVIDAVISITDTVESLHHRINRVSCVKGHPAQERTSGITGAVYNVVRGVTALVGNALNQPLKIIGDAFSERPHDPSLMAMRAALNGVLGDYLHNQKNSLAIDMHFSANNQRLSEPSLIEMLDHAIQNNNGKLLILAHGLCMNDRQWSHKGHDHGKALSRELGATSLYLNYNSGLHISDNGQHFAELLEKIVTLAQKRVRISIVAHSMGGLVSRSAHQYAQTVQHQWPDYVGNMVFLGTPHHGAPLEKTGNWLDLLLASHPYSAPFAKLIKIRSSGITDLHHGNLSAQDWQQRNRFDFRADTRKPAPLPEEIACFAVAGSIGEGFREKHLPIIGDGLVEVDSALGRHSLKPYTLSFQPQNQLHVRGVDHLHLLSEPRVYEKMLHWLRDKT
ncbi:MAG: esterase/lipase family protein [Aestuariibacter sp.]